MSRKIEALASPVPETWGDALRRHVNSAGSLDAIVRGLHSATGNPMLGTRNTFKKLFGFEACPDRPQDRYRAYLLLLTIGQDPAGWGLSDDDLPQALTPSGRATLRRNVLGI